MNNSQPWQKYPLIRKPLEEVNQLIQATIRTPYSDSVSYTHLTLPTKRAV
ncbi:MAG: hypothetical protein N5847_05125 [Lactobacillus crispatus]|nr:hypothetical protein [Lactobacillus crispatus]